MWTMLLLLAASSSEIVIKASTSFHSVDDQDEKVKNSLYFVDVPGGPPELFKRKTGHSLLLGLQSREFPFSSVSIIFAVKRYVAPASKQRVSRY